MNKNKNTALESLYKRVRGYEQIEETTEYIIDENGEKRPVKVKRQVKYVPPDVTAIKLYVEQVEKENTLSNMTDEELEKEKARIKGKLK
ncbi:MAG: hypothetical protein J6R44_03915 [Clostridia bacterium]|nr:hypothetical protein [Clostridia bacterium]